MLGNDLLYRYVCIINWVIYSVCLLLDIMYKKFGIKLNVFVLIVRDNYFVYLF